MNVCLTNKYSYFSELRSNAQRWSVPLSVDDVTPALGQLVDETFTRGILADELPGEMDELEVDIEPSWSTEPNVERVNITLTTGTNGDRRSVSQSFNCGPWVRSAEAKLQQLRSEGTITENDQVYRLLVAMKSPNADGSRCTLPPLAPPPIVDEADEIDAMQFGDGSLDPDRPVLVAARFVEEAISQCEAAGPMETGGAVLGKIVRLPAPLPGTRTRIVTILSAILTDARHAGNLTRFHISPEALLEGAKIADLRGRSESVLSIYHTHGWGCGECNQKLCELAESFPSLQDYELEALFPTKALLLPIAGRKLGAPGRRPVLQIHAWRGGQLRPIRWQTFRE